MNIRGKKDAHNSDNTLKGEALTKIDLLMAEILLNWVKEQETGQNPTPLTQFVKKNLKSVAEAIVKEGGVSSTFIPTGFCTKYHIAQRVLKELETLGVVSSPNKTGERKILITADGLDMIFRDDKTTTGTNK